MIAIFILMVAQLYVKNVALKQQILGYLRNVYWRMGFLNNSIYFNASHL